MRKIMIVDDDSTSVAIGRAFLDDEYEITIVRSGVQALGALKDNPLPDLVLLDMFMPGMDGIEVLKVMKKDDRLKGIPVIFLTGDKELDLEVEGYKNGAGDFLFKPVNRFLLKTKIKQYISHVELVNENEDLLRGKEKLIHENEELLHEKEELLHEREKLLRENEELKTRAGL